MTMVDAAGRRQQCAAHGIAHIHPQASSTSNQRTGNADSSELLDPQHTLHPEPLSRCLYGVKQCSAASARPTRHGMSMCMRNDRGRSQQRSCPVYDIRLRSSAGS